MSGEALSQGGRRWLRGFFILFVLFLYAPILMLVIFSFDKGHLPVFPLEGFTLRWYQEFMANPELLAALRTSAIVAALSSTVTVILVVITSIVLVRRRVFAKPLFSAIVLSPLVIPYIVFGISLLMLFRALGISLSIMTIVIGHVVISLPYGVLVLVPRLHRIETKLEEAARDLGAGPFYTFRKVTLPLILPAIVSAFLIAFTLSFDEFAVASFVAGSDNTYPIYLFSQLRFPRRLPQVIAFTVVIMAFSAGMVVLAEAWRRLSERKLQIGGLTDSGGN